MTFRANKTLGQHFLFNPSALNKILEKAAVSETDRVLEIGPGPGALTQRIAQRAGQVIAIEKDRRFAELLKKKFTGTKNITILEADFLELDFEKILGEPGPKWKVVANLPYNVATEILFRLLERASRFQSLHLMFQKEVATRIVSPPGSKDYSILSVMSQLFSENRIVMKLKPGSFTPPPKVDSAVVEFKIAEACRFEIDDLPTFGKTVRAAFGQRRKTILNALKGGGFEEGRITEALQGAGISPQARAETVPIERFALLANGLGALASTNEP